jgi:transcriptional regulator with XRE-family HTH domain/tetratricopeptide (TPR) repeat protein
VNAIGYQRDGVDPEEWDRPDMREALAVRDITRVYRLLQKIGFSQQRIAALTGQSQPEVSAIIHGRKVMAYDVLSRICDGLGAPRGYMGLAYDKETPTGPPAEDAAASRPVQATERPGWPPRLGPPYASRGLPPAGGEAEPAPAGPEPEEPFGRRAFLGQAAAITLGAAAFATDLGERPAAAAVPTPVPARIGSSDVEHIIQTTASLRALDYRYGGGSCRDTTLAELSWASRLLDSDCSEQVGGQLRVALADLYNLAGWTSLDIGQDDAARHFFLSALRLAKQAEESSLVSSILYRTGRISLHRGEPTEAIRLFQLGQLAAGEADAPLPKAVLAANLAWAHGQRGEAEFAHRALDQAEQFLARANLATSPAWFRFFDESDMEGMHGQTYLALGQTDPRYTERAIDRLDQAAHQRLPEMSRSRAFDLAALATAHLRQGDADHGAVVAGQALDAIERLKSARLVEYLRPLAAEVAQRRDNAELRDLADRLHRLIPAAPAVPA